MNRKAKQVLAIIGIVIIAALYIVTLILALIGNENTRPFFMASIICTILVPVVLYILSWMFNLVKGQAEDARNSRDENDSESEE